MSYCDSIECADNINGLRAELESANRRIAELTDGCENVREIAHNPRMAGKATAFWKPRALAAEAKLSKVREYWSDVEARSSDAHDVYQKEAHRRGDVRHADAYADLSEPTKEWDRVLVRWVQSTLARLAPGGESR